jgi:acetyl-CoA carboxylase carboxyl transferase subunit beta
MSTDWLSRARPGVDHDDGAEKRPLGAGVFRKCAGCGETMLTEAFAYGVCPRCNHHERLTVDQWTQLLLDPGTFEPDGESLAPLDPLRFSDGRSYPDRVASARRASGATEAVRVGLGTLAQRPIVFGAYVFRFMGGSMGSVVGERLTWLFERGAALRRPAVVLSSSGGARMQEGIFSLMQMARTVAALGRLRDAGMPFVSVLLDPTTGGVAASYALLGDVNLAEPRALIGFAGPRVIEQTIRQKLPEGFQRSEFLLEHGMIDQIVERRALRATLARVLGLLCDP